MAWQPEHKPQGDGDVCTRCHMHRTKHRQRRGDHTRQTYKEHTRIIAIDGEGVGHGGISKTRGEWHTSRLTNEPRWFGKWDHNHHYVYLAAIDEFGNGEAISEDEYPLDIKTGSLRTKDCLEFLIELPARSLVVGFALIYDLTMMLQDLDKNSLYMLTREHLRMRMKCVHCKRRKPWCKCSNYFPDGKPYYRPIHWWPPGEDYGYSINYMNRKFTVGRVRCSVCKLGPQKRGETNPRRCRCAKYKAEKRKTTVWDIFRFFQTSFIQSLETWKIGEPKVLAEIKAMKNLRGKEEFAADKDRVKAYCKQECHYLAQLTRKLIDEHEKAGIKLKTYFGAGSTASVLLKRWEIDLKRGTFPEEMRLPVACAFFGGRFENSVVGRIDCTVWDFDINSAYPYQTWRLPCLQHGHWSFHSGRPHEPHLSSRNAVYLVHWNSPQQKLEGRHTWGTLPVRTPKLDGHERNSILFPINGLGGWTWGEEFWAAEKLNPNIQSLEYWQYETDCDCRPFSEIPDFYRMRVLMGKEGKGITAKLGINSIYGKLAQSKGGIMAPFNSWIWAGLITSNTRAQLLRALLAAPSPSDVLMLATDGVWSTQRLDLEQPLDTGTFDLRNDKGELVPLGGWSSKTIKTGIFAMRPGVYFPINPTEGDKSLLRARGLGRKSVYEHTQDIIERFDTFIANDVPDNKMHMAIKVDDRFVGFKSGYYVAKQGDAREVRKRDCVGDWVPHTMTASFNPRPKRQRINRTDLSLETWEYLNFESIPYNAATISPEAMLLKVAEDIQREQPNEGEDSADLEDTEAA